MGYSHQAVYTRKQCSARSENIVDKQHVLVCQPFRPGKTKGFGHIHTPFVSRLVRLCLGIDCTNKCLGIDGTMIYCRQAACNPFRLIVTSPPLSPPMKRNGNTHIDIAEKAVGL